MTAHTELLIECAAQGVYLHPDGDGGLAINAPRGVLTPGMVDRLKARKAELLAVLRSEVDDARVDPTDATATWQAALDRLEGDPDFPPDLMGALRAADVSWASEPEADYGAEHVEAVGPCPCCDSRSYVDVTLPDGKIRRDCAECDRFLDWIKWTTAKPATKCPTPD